MADWSTLVQIVVGFGILVVVAAFAAAYYQFLRGKYYFQREEAGRRARNLGYLLIVLLVLLLGVRIATPWLTPFVEEFSRRFAWGRLRPPPTARPALLPSPTPTPSPGTEASPTPSPSAPSPRVTHPSQPTPSPTHTLPPTPTPSPTPSPHPVVQGSHFQGLILARGLDDDNQPIGEGTTFHVDDRPVYAIFQYQGMRNGMEWSQQWWRGDDILWEGKGPWEWGTAGRAWVYFTPEFGWTVGRYQVRLYVEGQLEQVADFTME